MPRKRQGRRVRQGRALRPDRGLVRGARVRATRGSGSGRCGWPGCRWRGSVAAIEPDLGQLRARTWRRTRRGSGGARLERGLGLDQPDREVVLGLAERDHQPRVRAQVADLDGVGLGEHQHRLAVPPEPRRDEVREAVRADRRQPHDGLRGEHRPDAFEGALMRGVVPRPPRDARGRCPVGRRGGEDAAEELHARRLRAVRSQITRRGSSRGMDIRRCLIRTPEFADDSGRGLTRSRVRSTHTA